MTSILRLSFARCSSGFMITDSGDSRFMLGEQVEWWKFEEDRDAILGENERLLRGQAASRQRLSRCCWG